MPSLPTRLLLILFCTILLNAHAQGTTSSAPEPVTEDDTKSDVSAFAIALNTETTKTTPAGDTTTIAASDHTHQPDEEHQGPAFVGCISHELFDETVREGVVGGNGQMSRVANTKECMEQCQQTQASPPLTYAYYRPQSHQCYCANDQGVPTAIQVGDDSASRRGCQYGSAKGFYLPSSFALKGCYASLSPPHPAAVNAVYADRPHLCLDSCAVADDPIQNYTITRASMELLKIDINPAGTEGEKWWHFCRCFRDHTHVKGWRREKCRVGSEFSYTRR